MLRRAAMPMHPVLRDPWDDRARVRAAEALLIDSDTKIDGGQVKQCAPDGASCSADGDCCGGTCTDGVCGS